MGRKPFEDLEAASEVVGRHEVGQMRSELLVIVVVIAIDRRFLEGTVHPLDLTIRPRVIGFGQAVFDTACSADLIEAVDPVTRRPAIAIFRQVGKLDTVIGQHRMQPVRYGRDQCFEEAHGGRTIGFVVQCDEGEFRGSVNRDKQVELALCCSNLSDVDMEIADRVGLEFSFFGALVLTLRQARNAMPFQTTMQ